MIKMKLKSKLPKFLKKNLKKGVISVRVSNTRTILRERALHKAEIKDYIFFYENIEK